MHVFRYFFQNFIISMISEEKNDPMSIKNLAQFAVDAVKHQDPEVRQAGQDLVLMLYKVTEIFCAPFFIHEC